MGIMSWDKYVFVFGGYNGREEINSVEKYSIETDTWSIVSPMKLKRAQFPVVPFGKYLYAIGGLGIKNIIDKVKLLIDKKINIFVNLDVSMIFYMFNSNYFFLNVGRKV